MKNKIPQHIAIIPDANRRWAKQRNIKPWEGHREGIKGFSEISNAAADLGITYITFWAGSEDNLTKRTKKEVAVLTSLLRHHLEKDLKESSLKTNGVRFKLIGRWDEILQDKKLRKVVHDLEKQTENNNKFFLTILFGYDGRREMQEAIKMLRKETGQLTYSTIKQSLWTGDLPYVDLVIRTGSAGDPHWSAGFMMWLTANSQLYFTDTFWPDFKTANFKKAVGEFTKRERRLGS